MSVFDPIAEYLEELSICLQSQGQSSGRILREVEDHLIERVADLRDTGWSLQDAQQEAIDRFGSIPRVVKQFQQSPPLPSEEEVMIRSSLTALAAVTSAYAAMHIFFSWFNEPNTIISYVKIICALVVITSGAVIIHWQWTSKPIGLIEKCAILIGGLELVEIGTANIVWDIHLGLVSGNWEYYGFIGGALIGLLGAVAACCLMFPEFPKLERARLSSEAVAS